MITRIGLWIKNHLMEVEEDYGYSMWKKYHNDTFPTRNTNYGSFRNYMYWLKKAGLIEEARRTQGKVFERVYYRISKKGLQTSEKEWSGPSELVP